jgi:hypothetical protein
MAVLIPGDEREGVAQRRVEFPPRRKSREAVMEEAARRPNKKAASVSWAALVSWAELLAA